MGEVNTGLISAKLGGALYMVPARQGGGSSSASGSGSAAPSSGSAAAPGSGTAAGGGGGNQAGPNQPINHPANAPTNDTGVNGTLRANLQNGPIVVDDPSGQNYVYNHNGTNQPLLGNIARVLDKQASLNTTFSRFTFSPNQKDFILEFLMHQHAQTYEKLTLKEGPYDKPPFW